MNTILLTIIRQANELLCKLARSPLKEKLAMRRLIARKFMRGEAVYIDYYMEI